MAYTHKQLQHPNKLLVGLHTDVRSAFLGSKLNPMIRVPLDCIASDEEHLLPALTHYWKFGTLTDFAVTPN